VNRRGVGPAFQQAGQQLSEQLDRTAFLLGAKRHQLRREDD